MPRTAMGGRRKRAVLLVRVLALAGATTLAVLAFQPLPAGADPTNVIFSGTASATGVRMAIDTNPPAIPVSDAFDVQVPGGVSQLTSTGTAKASASLASPGNSGSGIALICTADPRAGQLCQGINSATSQTPIGPFPPDFPLTATASYPENGGKPVTAAVSSPPLGAGAFKAQPASATALAGPTEVSTQSGVGSASLAAGTPLAMTSGTATETTHQTIADGKLTVTANSTVKNITIGGVIHIDQITSIATASNDGQGHTTKTGSVTASGVTVAGQPASIDNTGIHLGSQGDKGLLGQTVSKTLQQVLSSQGFTIQLLGLDTTSSQDSVSADVGGLVIQFKRTVTGLPNPNQYLPVCLPAPSDCVLTPPDPNADYIGTVAFGQASATAYATPAPTFDFGSFGFGNLAGTPSTGPTTTFMPGTPGTPGTPGMPGLAPNGVPNPLVAGAQKSEYVNAGNLLKGTSDRMKLVFPALFLAALGALAGGVFRYPSRLPRAGSG